MPDRAARIPGLRRMPGRAGWFVVRRLYLAPDHFLLVETRAFTERYRRLFFRDLEAFSIHHTDAGLWTRFVSGFIAAICWGLMFLAWPEYSSDSRFGAIFFGSVAFLGTVICVRDFLMGQSCTCFARTAVQMVELPSLNRVARAMRARVLLLERITEVQGGLLGSASEVQQRPAARSDAQPSAPVPEAVRTRALRALIIQAVALSTTAAAVLYDYYESALWASGVNILLSLAALIAAITQMVFGRKARLGRGSFWAGLAVPCIAVWDGLVFYVAMVTLMVRDVRAPVFLRAEDSYLRVFRVAPGTSVMVDVAHISVATAYGVAALAAWALWVRLSADRRERAGGT